MKIIKEIPTKFNGTRVLLQLNAGEKLVAVKEDSFYTLGQPMDDVVPGHVMTQAQLVCWCPIEQKWVVA